MRRLTLKWFCFLTWRTSFTCHRFIRTLNVCNCVFTLTSSVISKFKDTILLPQLLTDAAGLWCLMEGEPHLVCTKLSFLRTRDIYAVTDTAYMSCSLDKPNCPLRPDVLALKEDIAQCTNARQAAGEALPVLPGTTHISKVAYPAAPNLTVFNYIIQVTANIFLVSSYLAQTFVISFVVYIE